MSKRDWKAEARELVKKWGYRAAQSKSEVRIEKLRGALADITDIEFETGSDFARKALAEDV